MNKDILFFEPEFKNLIWGGNRMRNVFGYNIPTETTGECWAVSAHPSGDCRCITPGYEGYTLSKLWEERKELFGNIPGTLFPLLIKIIDAKTDLSIQVHPDDEYAAIHEKGALGKTECWYVLDCEEGSTLVIGHRADSRDELCKLIDENRYSELIKEIPVKKGDFIQIEPGTIHAIKGGVMILETQQNSDITYRVYDYDRLFNGKKRDIHVAQSKEVISVPSLSCALKHTSTEPGRELLIKCKYYSVEKINVAGNCDISEDAPFRIVSCIEGRGFVNGIEISKGSHFLVPSGYGTLCFSGDMTLIASVPEI